MKPAVVLLCAALLPGLPAGRVRAADAPDAGGECVVLLHGLGRTPRSMAAMQRYLTGRGYSVTNVGYPSRSRSVEGLTDFLESELARIPRDPQQPVHFVTHSLGGILVRNYASRNGHCRIGRVVMLAPPNAGSTLVDRLGGFALYRLVTGPAGLQLGTGADSVPNRLGPPAFDLGVIAGDRTCNLFYSWLIPGPDDGKVAVARTGISGARDLILVHATHTFMMRNRRVMECTARFLRTGAFADAHAASPLRSSRIAPQLPIPVHLVSQR